MYFTYHQREQIVSSGKEPVNVVKRKVIADLNPVVEHALCLRCVRKRRVKKTRGANRSQNYLLRPILAYNSHPSEESNRPDRQL